MDDFENIIKKACDDNMKRIIKRKRKHKEIEEIEPVWLTQEIKKEISIRRNYKKEKRINPGSEELDNLYIKQRNKVKALVKEAISQHEQKVTDEIEKKKKMEEIRQKARI